ncbi:C_GCAxxG_C_C family protein [bacterium]|nr:C_GCAxxG_C_C family protein [bacterium]
MTKELIEKKTFDCFQSGYCCSESICKIITEHFGKPPADIAKATSAFCGGIGGSHKDLCGALTGGFIAIGWLFGRTAPGQDNTPTNRLTTEYQHAFVRQFGSANCEVLLDSLGEQTDGLKCKNLTAKAAGILYDAISAQMGENVPD